MDISVIIPVYNGARTLGRCLEGLAASSRPPAEVLVVDDNSPDGTGGMVEELNASDPRITLISRAKKSELGTAYIAGFDYALRNGYDYIFEMDSDFSHDPNYIPDFLKAIKDSDLVLGSRYIRGVNVVNWPITRLLLSYFANVYARWVTGLPVKDSTSGFKCFKREVLEKIGLDNIHSNGYAFQIEMSFRAWRKGFKIKEIPIIFVDRRAGESKMSKKIVREAIWMVWRLRIANLLGKI